MAMMSDRAKKWFLVIVMSLLMVAFTLPSWFGQGGGGGRDFAIGTLADNQKLMASEVQLARFEWQELSGITIPLLIETGFGQPQVLRAPLPALLFVGDLSRPLGPESRQIVETLLTLYTRSPELYALLKREARQQGIRSSQDRVNSVMTNLVPPNLLTDNRRMASLRQSVVGLLAVEALRDQAMSTVKVTRPEVTSLLARNVQTLNVVAVPISATEFATLAPAPDDATLRDLFTRFADKTAGTPDRTTNPFGFGYRQGDRLRLEHIYVSRQELRRAARATREDYDWEVEAQKFYQSNRARFEVPTTQPADAFSLTPAPANTLRPFAEVRTQIEDQLIDTKAEEIRRTVERRLTAALNADFRAFADAQARNQPAPATSLGHPYNSFDYLSALAERIQRDTGVRPTVVTHGETFLDLRALADLDGVGTAFLETSAGRELPLPNYLLARARPLFDAAGNNREQGASALEPLEPTPVATTFDGGFVIARFLDARPNRVPEFDEVADLVRADATTQAVFNLALAAARSLADTQPDQPLAGVAALQSRTAIPLRDFTDGAFLPPPLSAISPQSRANLIEETFNLLRRPEAFASARPRTVIPLERDNLVVVVELDSVNPVQRFTEPARLEIQVFQQVMRQAEEQYRLSFFVPDTVHQRTGFKPTRPGDATAAAD